MMWNWSNRYKSFGKSSRKRFGNVLKAAIENCVAFGRRTFRSLEMTETLTDVVERLSRIEAVLQTLVRDKAVKDLYSTAEVAGIVGKAEYTVREWCRQKRMHASKKPYSRGAHPEWLISHAELVRFRNEGLLPIHTLEGGS